MRQSRYGGRRADTIIWLFRMPANTREDKKEDERENDDKGERGRDDKEDHRGGGGTEWRHGSSLRTAPSGRQWLTKTDIT